LKELFSKEILLLFNSTNMKTWFLISLYTTLLPTLLFAQTPNEATVSLNYKETPLKEILNELSENFELNFSYFSDLPLDKKISIDLKDAPLETALDLLFENTGLKYNMVGQQVVVKQMMEKLSLAGKILDKETNEPLGYATVSIKGKQVGVVSNPNGEFGLLIPENYRNDTLFISMLGYDNYEVNLAQFRSNENMKIVLNPANYLLEEVVVKPDQVYIQKIKPAPSQKKGASASIIYGKFVSYAHYTLDASNLELFKIKAGAGELTLLPNTINEIDIEAEIITVSVSKAENQKFIDKYLKLTMSEKNAEVTLNSGFDFYENRINKKGKKKSNFPLTHLMATPGSKINLTIKLPKNLYTKVYDGAGDIEVEGIKTNIFIKDGSGKINIKKVTGDLEVIDRSGSLDINQVVGNVTISDKSGYLEAKKIKGSLDIIDSSGEITLEEVSADSLLAQSIKIIDHSGGLVMNDIEGNLELKDKSGGISIKNIQGNVQVRDRSGGIDIKEIDGLVRYKDRSGKVHVQQKR